MNKCDKKRNKYNDGIIGKNTVHTDCNCNECVEFKQDIINAHNRKVEIWGLIEQYAPKLPDEIGWGSMDSLCDEIIYISEEYIEEAVQQERERMEKSIMSIHPGRILQYEKDIIIKAINQG